MKIQINLATRPYVELRPFFMRLRIIMGALAVAMIVLAVVTHSMQKKLAVAAVQMDKLKAQTEKAQGEKQRNESKMRQPANAAVLARSRFLNTLFLSKSFSWTAVMMDLENVLPTGVQVTAIEPQVTTDGYVTIHLRVAGDRDRAVQLVRNLERSKRFIAPRISSENSQAKEGSANATPNGAPAGVEFEILATYNPLPEDVKLEKVKAEKPAVKAKPKVVKPGPHDGIVLKPYVKPQAGSKAAVKQGGAA